MGLEPTREYTHKILSLARLPIPTLPLTAVSVSLNNKTNYSTTVPFRQYLFLLFSHFFICVYFKHKKTQVIQPERRHWTGSSPFFRKRKKSRSLDLLFSCGRWDLNPHENTPTRSLVLLVCQFRHFRLPSLFHLRVPSTWHNITQLEQFVNTFLKFFQKILLLEKFKKEVDKSSRIYYNIFCR